MHGFQKVRSLEGEHLHEIYQQKFKDQFMNVNMKRNFVPRPSIDHPAFKDFDPIFRSGLSDSVADGLG